VARREFRSRVSLKRSGEEYCRGKSGIGTVAGYGAIGSFCYGLSIARFTPQQSRLGSVESFKGSCSVFEESSLVI
jgi:hypothetical protein